MVANTKNHLNGRCCQHQHCALVAYVLDIDLTECLYSIIIENTLRYRKVKDIPYALLTFHPMFKMSDLPTTSRKQATDCLVATETAGLKRVRIGNIRLLA